MLIGKRIFVLESTGVISQAPLAELMTFGQDVSAEARILLHSHTEYSHSMTQVYSPAEILLPYDILCKPVAL